MFFQPYTDYIITRQLYNEQDFGQKYAKAWVYDALTDEVLLDGVGMTEGSDNKGRFRYTYRLPGDPTGQGRQLRVISVIYEDSGYTTKDVNYQVEETNITVRDLTHLGGGGGGSVDYDFLKEMFDKIISSKIALIPTQKEVDLTPIKLAIETSVNSILREIQGIEMPNIPTEIEKTVVAYREPQKVDLEPILERIEEAKEEINRKIDDKKVTEVDLSSLEKSSKELVEENKKTQEMVEEIPVIVVPVGNVKMTDIKKVLVEQFNKEREDRVDFEDEVIDLLK